MAAPRKSIEQHLAAGTYRPDRHSPRAAAPSGAPEQPADLPAETVWLWELVCSSCPTISPLDGPALAMLCELWLQHERFKHEVSPNKYYMALSALKQFTRLAERFGLDPASRERLRIPATPAKADDDSQFFGLVD